ncbi:lmo0937 family membrane protein [Reinekea sp. G2M2-21]|nr:lmo0937 family membrane protein [Reinekea sp. G2M2-21]
MLSTIAILLLILWGVGLLSAYTLGGFIHILLIIAIGILIARMIQGRRL